MNITTLFRDALITNASKAFLKNCLDFRKRRKYINHNTEEIFAKYSHPHSLWTTHYFITGITFSWIPEDDQGENFPRKKKKF